MTGDEEDIINEVSEYCFQLLDEVADDPSRLSIPVQTVIAIYSGQSVIDNGNFQFFFQNDFPGTPPYSFFINAYRRIGAEQAANNIETAVELFQFSDPHMELEKRIHFLNEIGDTDCLFNQLGDEVCGDGSVWEKLSDYVMINLHEFGMARH